MILFFKLETVSGVIVEPKNYNSTGNTQINSSCPGAPQKRLEVGGNAIVCTRRETVYLRTSPKKSASYTHRLVPGAELRVIGGPICDERPSWWYWEIRTESGYEGWMAEGGDTKDSYFLCPVK